MTDMEIEPANLIFQPSEALSQRVIDAEKKVLEAENERDQIRKSRSRAQLLAIVAFVAFATSLLMGLGIFTYTSNQIAENKAEAAKNIATAEAKELKALALADSEKTRAELIRAEYTELQKYRNIGDLEITLEQLEERLRNTIEQHKDPQYAVPNQDEIFARTPGNWEFENQLDLSVWTSEVSKKLSEDIGIYNQIFTDLETARAIANVDPPAPMICVRKNPFDNNPVQNC